MATKKQVTKTAVVETPKATATPKTATAKKTTAAAKKTTTAKAATTKTAKTTATKAAAPKKAATKKAVTAKINFTLPKEAVENAETVALLGDFNNWDADKSIQLKKQKDGSFKTAVALEKGRSYQFRFLIDNTTWENAWDADAYEPTPFGAYNSVVNA
ncbi:MAG: isoamylase early set domain-containing protein [Saprospiraceae bacterium]